MNYFYRTLSLEYVTSRFKTSDRNLRQLKSLRAKKRLVTQALQKEQTVLRKMIRRLAGDKFAASIVSSLMKETNALGMQLNTLNIQLRNLNIKIKGAQKARNANFLAMKFFIEKDKEDNVQAV